jgi:hypothetical protein
MNRSNIKYKQMKKSIFKKADIVDEIHGIKISDPYRLLENLTV